MHELLDAGLSQRGRHQDRYLSFAELAIAEREEIDFRIVVQEVPGASIAVVSPHGGGIERGTSQIAHAIARNTHHLYLFEGLKPRGNFHSLHITSRRFDEPRCLALLARSETVITVHGCIGLEERVYIGGLHEELKQAIAETLCSIGVDAQLDNHTFPAIDSDNICNRGRGGRGVQLEFTAGLRRQMRSQSIGAAIRAQLTQLR